MTIVRLRPNATISNSGFVFGTASAHAALSDNSDLTWVSFENTSFRVGLTDLTVPAGAVITGHRVVLRTGRESDFPPAVGCRLSFSSSLLAIQEITWFEPTTTAYPAERARTKDELDAVELSVGATIAEPARRVRIYEASVDVTCVLRPVVDVMSPSGTLTINNLPAVAWSTSLDVDGGAQSSFEVKVFTDAQYLAGAFNPDSSTPHDASGVLAGAATSWQPAVAQPSDIYRSYVRVAQTVNGQPHWSAWDFATHTINLTAPGPPSLAVAPSDENASILILVADGSNRWQVQRSDDLGATWQNIRDVVTSLPFAGIPVLTDQFEDDPAEYRLTDWEAPLGRPVLYRARAVNRFGSPPTLSYVASAWVEVQTAVNSTAAWIKDPIAPSQNLPVTVFSRPDRRRAARQGIFQALGADLPVVISERRAGATGVLRLLLEPADRQALDDLIDSGRTLLIQYPGPSGEPQRYVRIGDHDSTRIVDKAFISSTFDDLPWIEVAKPTDDLLPGQAVPSSAAELPGLDL